MCYCQPPHREICDGFKRSNVEGELLSERLKRGPLAIRDAIDFAAQTADALSEAHSLGIVHCDVKASNLTVNERGMVKPLDEYPEFLARV